VHACQQGHHLRLERTKTTDMVYKDNKKIADKNILCF